MPHTLIAWTLMLFAWTGLTLGEAFVVARITRPPTPLSDNPEDPDPPGRTGPPGRPGPVVPAPLWTPEAVAAVGVQATLILGALLAIRLPLWLTAGGLGFWAGWRGHHWPSPPPLL